MKRLRNLQILLPGLWAGVLAVFLLPTSAFAQCAMCSEALLSDPKTAGLVDGFRFGIYFLLIMFYSVVGCMLYLMAKASAKSTARLAARAGI